MTIDNKDRLIFALDVPEVDRAKLLVNELGDSSIVRQFWESYGTQITNSPDPVSFFSIFNDAILYRNC